MGLDRKTWAPIKMTMSIFSQFLSAILTLFTRANKSRRVPFLQQTEATECGLACLAMIGNFHGHHLNLNQMRHRFSTSLKGITLDRMVDIARSLGFNTRAVRADVAALNQLALPCVLHWNLNHFVVLQSINGNRAEIIDPAKGRFRMPLEKFGQHFTGIALEMRVSDNFIPETGAEAVTLRTLLGHITGLKKILFQIFGLALLIELLSIALPFQLQLILDQVLTSRDPQLLMVIAASFLAIVVLQACLVIARGWVISWFGVTLNTQWINNLFGHLLRLPMDYFEKRHMGDVISRFTSIRIIQSTISGSFIESILDGIMGTLAFAILLCYSVPVALLVLLVLAIYYGLRSAIFRKQRLLNEEQLIHRSHQDSELMESVRGVRSIKLADKVDARRERLANATLETASRDLQIQRISLSFGAVNRGLFGIQRIALITVGAWFCLNGKLSTGMIVALLAYADQFISKATSVIDKVIDFKMLRLHAERIADIAQHDVEKNELGSHTGPMPDSCITLRDVNFRYADGDPWVLKKINLHIRAGESVAITGSSGSGKTTLIKILLGLFEPVEGTVEIGNVTLNDLGKKNYRHMVAAVMQDDQLFAGSIADNISFFEQGATYEQIENAARLASIHDDIINMPMGYESLVGDMGSSLSGGQKQRVILARALFRSPSILVLDEATSHLDVKNEQSINEAVKKMHITRIIIAHRKETIASADRVIVLENGMIVSGAG